MLIEKNLYKSSRFPFAKLRTKKGRRKLSSIACVFLRVSLRVLEVSASSLRVFDFSLRVFSVFLRVFIIAAKVPPFLTLYSCNL